MSSFLLLCCCHHSENNPDADLKLRYSTVLHLNPPNWQMFIWNVINNFIIAQELPKSPLWYYVEKISAVLSLVHSGTIAMSKRRVSLETFVIAKESTNMSSAREGVVTCWRGSWAACCEVRNTRIPPCTLDSPGMCALRSCTDGQRLRRPRPSSLGVQRCEHVF